MNTKWMRGTMVLLESFVSLTAIAGGIALLVTNGMGMPTEWLQGSSFSSYLIPGLVLMHVVGGANASAASMVIAKHPIGLLMSQAAGTFMISFEIVEIAVIKQLFWLQALYLALGLIILAQAILLWQAVKPQPTQTLRVARNQRTLADNPR